MKYRNIKTGVVINVSSEISGDDWVKVSSSVTKVTEPGKKNKEEPKKKTTRK